MTNRPFPYVLFSLLIVLDIGAWLIEKLASIRSEGQGWQLVMSYLLQPWVWIVVGIKLAQLFTWSAILARVEISRAFPLTAAATPLAIIASMVFFRDHPTWQVWVGSLVITAGVVLLGPDKSERRAPAETLGGGRDATAGAQG